MFPSHDQGIQLINGGSKKQMLDDEKHISKLAGDLKYDAKKKRKYDNV